MNLFENLQTMNEESTVLNSIESTKEFMSKHLAQINDIAFANVLREILFHSNIEWKDVQLVINRHMPEVKIESKFNEETPQKTLSNYTVNQIDYINRGYEKFVKEIGDAYVDERESNASQIKNELAADCIENEIVTSEEFEDIWNAFEKLRKFNSHAYA